MKNSFCSIRAESKFTATTAALFLFFVAVARAEEPPSQPMPSKPTLTTDVSKTQQVHIERYRAQYADEDRLIASLAAEDRAAMIENLANGMRAFPHPSDPVPETTFQMCLVSRRLARLLEELTTEPEASKTAEAIFDDDFRELQKLINTVVDSWEQGGPPKRFLPIQEQSYAVCAGLFLCMEHASLDSTLKRVDRWQNYGQLITARLRGLTLSEAALEKLSMGNASSLVESLRKDPQHWGRLLDNDVGRCARPEALFLVNAYVRLMQKHCQPENVIAELPEYFQKRQRPQVLPIWNWRSHPIASSLARQFVIESIEEDRSLHSYTVYTGWGFLQDEQKQKLTTQIRECLERCGNLNAKSAEE